MKIQSAVSISLLLTATTLGAAELPTFNIAWITERPEVLTYQSKAKQGDGLFQVSVARTKNGIEHYINIITPGFTKSVWGTMTTNMQPLESKSRIIVKDQINLTSDCSYNGNSLHIATVIRPSDRVVENTLSNSDLVVDFSQTPLLARTLPLKLGACFQFNSLNPQNNSLMPMTIRVVGEETIQNIACHKLEMNDYEGQAITWIEKGGSHRVIRFEQPAAGRITELMQ